MTFLISQSQKPGFVQIVRPGIAGVSEVFVGEAARQFTAGLTVRALQELPAQKWCSVIAA